MCLSKKIYILYKKLIIYTQMFSRDLKQSVRTFERIHGGGRNLQVRRFVNYYLVGGETACAKEIKNRHQQYLFCETDYDVEDVQEKCQTIDEVDAICQKMGVFKGSHQRFKAKIRTIFHKYRPVRELFGQILTMIADSQIKAIIEKRGYGWIYGVLEKPWMQQAVQRSGWKKLETHLTKKGLTLSNVIDTIKFLSKKDSGLAVDEYVQSLDLSNELSDDLEEIVRSTLELEAIMSNPEQRSRDNSPKSVTTQLK